MGMGTKVVVCSACNGSGFTMNGRTICPECHGWGSWDAVEEDISIEDEDNTEE